MLYGYVYTNAQTVPDIRIYVPIVHLTGTTSEELVRSLPRSGVSLRFGSFFCRSVLLSTIRLTSMKTPSTRVSLPDLHADSPLAITIERHGKLDAGRPVSREIARARARPLRGSKRIRSRVQTRVR